MTNVQSLEEVLGQVDVLRRDLTAEIVVQEEETSEIPDYGSGWDDYMNDAYSPGGLKYRSEVIKPRIAHPDTQRQEEARQKLQESYNSSDWYSVRYVAGRALGIRDNQPGGRLSSWVRNLEGQLSAEIVVQEGEGHTEKGIVGVKIGDNLGVPGCNYSGPSGFFESFDFPSSYESSNEYVIDKLRIAHPDTKIRERARKDLDRLTSELRKTYDNSSINFEERKAVGKALRYSDSKIWTDEHPIVATFSGLAAAGVVSGIGYMLYQYLSR
jgi:hypothetical protein